VLNENTANALCDVTKQVLAYAQQSRERTNYEQAALTDRMQEYRQQMEQENQRSFSDVDSLATRHGIQVVGRSSHKLIEAVMQSTPRGKVCSTSFLFFSGCCLRPTSKVLLSS
jgi:hypothetical protein